MAEFFCAAKPFHSSTNTFAPNDFAISTVRSVEPESTTMISPLPSATSGCTLASVRPIFASSLNVIITTERVIGGMRRFQVHGCEGVVYQGAWARTCRAQPSGQQQVPRLRSAIAKRNRTAALGMTQIPNSMTQMHLRDHRGGETTFGLRAARAELAVRARTMAIPPEPHPGAARHRARWAGA